MKLYELISDESKYDPSLPAQDQYGRSVTTDSVYAVKWSVRGALFRCYRNLTIVDYFMVFQKVKDALEDTDLSDYSSVIKVLKKLDI